MEDETNQQINVEEWLKRIQEEEEYVKNQVLSYQEYLPDFVANAKEDLQVIESSAIELEKNPEDSEAINAIFRSFHNIKGSSGFVGQNTIQSLAHQTESMLDNCRKGTLKITPHIADLILKSADIIKAICDNLELNDNEEFLSQAFAHIEDVEEAEKSIATQQSEPQSPKLGEMLVQQNKLTPEDVDAIVEKQKTDYPELKFGEVAIQEKKVEPKDILDVIRAQKAKGDTKEESIRISTIKVDNLVDMVGELIITQSLVEQLAFRQDGACSDFSNNFNRMTRITKDLQNLSMELRMVPLKSTFQKVTRVARDTINTLGKKIDFTTSGDETEIDRIVTEKLMDPLVHLVKNAISHGVEEDRTAAGKPETGHVRMIAYNKRGNIYIEVSDDGGGINTQKVYKKALEKGLIEPNREYSEKEIQEFIMLPGFSTLEKADSISGRGVGMDVVKTEIIKNGGKIDIHSEQGKGTTFILRIPVNHAIMNGTIVDIEGMNYIIPTVHVKQITQPKEDQWIFIQGKKSKIKIREDIINLVSVKELFGSENEEEAKLILVLELDQKYVALPVKNVVNRQEIVVKPVAEEFLHLDYISGMSILGDGKVSLILDVENLFKKKSE